MWKVGIYEGLYLRFVLLHLVEIVQNDPTWQGDEQAEEGGNHSVAARLPGIHIRFEGETQQPDDDVGGQRYEKGVEEKQVK